MSNARRSRLATTGGNLGALIVGLAVALGGLELGVRALASTLGLTSYMQYDERIGWSAKAGAVKRHRDAGAGFDVTYEINSQGLRGKPHSHAKPPGVRRVLLLGDSNGFGWGIAEGGHLAALLSESLATTEVVNLSLAGYSTDQQLLRLVRDGLPYDPDIVVLQLTPNDLEEIQFSFFNQKPKPRFVLDATGHLTLKNVPVLAEGPKAAEFYANSLPVPFKAWLDWNSYAYGFLNGQYHAARRSRAGRGGAPPPDQFSADNVALFNRLVEEIRATAERVGARTIVVHAIPELSARPLLKTSATVVDMYPDMAAAKERGTSPWYPDGYHWNPAGHAMVADRLRGAIESMSGPR